MPLASLITPNLSEAEVLTEHRIGYVDEMKAAASELLKFGCGSVLLKGGHLEGDKMCDVLQIVGEDKPHLFISDKIESKTHTEQDVLFLPPLLLFWHWDMICRRP